MSATTIATAYISLVPSLDGFSERLNAALSPAESSAKSAGVKAGEGFSSGFSGAMKSASGSLDSLAATASRIKAPLLEVQGQAVKTASAIDKIGASAKPVGAAVSAVADKAKLMGTSVIAASGKSSDSMVALTKSIKGMSAELGTSTTGGISALDRLAAAAQQAGAQATVAMDRYRLEMAKDGNATLPAIAGLDKFGAAATVAAAKAEDALSAYARAAAVAGAEAGAGLSQGVGRGMGEAESRMSKASAGIKDLAGGLVAGFAIGGAIDFFKEAGKAAEDDAVAVRMVKGVYGEASETVLKFSETAAGAYGMSAGAANAAAAKMGQFLSAMGITGQTAADLSVKVIGLSADIGKFANADPATVEQAIQGALKGRGAAMAQFGVHISTATVQEEALTEGLIKQGQKMTDTQRATATLGLIMKDTASAQGAFGASSSELGTSQAILKAKMEDMSAAIGKAVLPLLQSLSTLAVDVVIPAFQALVGLVTPLIAVFTNMSGPMKAAAVAFGAFLLLRGPLTAMSLGIRNFVGDIKAIKVNAEESGRSISTMGATAQRSAGLLSSIGTAGVFVVAALIIDSFTKSLQNAQAVTDSVAGSTKLLSDALVASKGAWTAATEAALENSVTGTEQFKSLLDHGVAYADAMDLVTGKTKDARKVLSELFAGDGSADDKMGGSKYIVGLLGIKDAAMATSAAVLNYNAANAATAAVAAVVQAGQDAQTSSLTNQAAALYALSPAMVAAAAETQMMAKGQDEAKAGAVALTASMTVLAKSTDASRLTAYVAGLTRTSGAFGITAEQAKLAQGYIKTVGVAMTDAAKASDLKSMTESIKSVTNATSAASQAVQGFSIQIDLLTGRNVPLQDATKNLNDEVRAMSTAFQDASKATNGQFQSLVNAKGQIDTTTDAGSKLYDSVTKYKNAYDVSTIAAENAAGAHATVAQKMDAARTAADNAYGKFMAQAAAMGINQTVAANLAQQMGILQGQQLTPKILNLSAQDAASGVVDALNAKVQALADKVVTVTVLTSGQTVTTNSAGQSVQTNADGSFTTASGAVGKADGGYISGPGGPREDKIPAMLSNGEFVVNAASTAKYLPLLHNLNKFADGGLVNVNMAGSGNIQGAVDGVNAIFSNADHSASVANAAASAAAAITSAAVPAASSAGVAQWVPLMVRVITEKLGAAMVPVVEPVMAAQMEHESSGNPAAINNYDINAQRGDPSRGLLQFIMSTFKAYADPGYNQNIYDPESQMRAFMNYVPATYGSFGYLTSIGNGAYADGGFVSGPGTGTSDSIAARLSNGEFVVNAAAAAKNSKLLLALNGGNGNAGSGHNYAQGGSVNTGPVNVNALDGALPPVLADRLQRVVQGISDLGIIITNARAASAADRVKAVAAQAALLAAQKAAGAATLVSARRYETIAASSANAISSAQAKVAAAIAIQTAETGKTSAKQAAADRARVLAAEKTLTYTQQTQQGRLAAAGATTGAAGVQLARQEKLTAVAVALANAADRAAVASQRLLASWGSQEQSMKRLAVRYDVTNLALQTAETNLAAAQSNRTQLASSVTSSAQGYGGGLTGFSAQRGNFGAILQGQQYNLAQVKHIEEMASALKARGLAAESIQSAVAAAEGGDSVTINALSTASAQQIAQLNATTSQLTKFANQTGTVVAGAMFNAGIAAGQGIVSGLKTQEAIINAHMVWLANSMALAMKRALGIKSPSTVFHNEVGIPIAAGIISGMASQTSAVARGAASLVKVPQVAGVQATHGGTDYQALADAVRAGLHGASMDLNLNHQVLAKAVLVGNQQRSRR